MNHKCELCSMDGVYLKPDEQGVVRYYCQHHAPTGSTIRGGEVLPEKTSFKTYLPLVVIFLVVLFVTLVASALVKPFSFDFAMRIFMGTFFAVFGLLKIINLKAFAEAYRTYDILAMRSRTYALLYPFIEIAFALLYIFDAGGLYRDIATIVIMGISGYGVFKKLYEKEEIPCACLGMVFKVPMTWVTLLEDMLMVVMAILMLFA